MFQQQANFSSPSGQNLHHRPSKQAVAQSVTDQQWQDSVWLVSDTSKTPSLFMMDKYLAHQNPGVLHRAVSVWLVNDQGQVLFQQRSAQKIVGALEWGNAVCGNQRYLESPLHCAYRRLYQELGLGFEDNWQERLDLINPQAQKVKLNNYLIKFDLKLQALGNFTYQVKCNDQYGEYEQDQLLVGKLSASQSAKIRLNPQEVAQVKWLPIKDLLENKVDLTLTPWTKMMLETKDPARKKLKFYLESNS